MVYIKFSNGSTSMLIDMYNEVKQNEAIENGFHMEIELDGTPIVVESSQLEVSEDVGRAEMLERIREKLGGRSENMKAKRSLSARYGN